MMESRGPAAAVTPRIRIVEQDIASLDVDAVTNAANDHLWMGAGVAGALKKSGGDEIEREAMSKGPIAVGDAIITGGGRLKARHVIHAAVMRQFVPHSNADAVARATRSALARAEEIGARTLALPALGTGVGGFSREECARIMIAAVREHTGNIEEVIFALRGGDTVRAFERELASS
jgi:O-acetyl-ADP-ribose deacetylase (regulator of RNase III)